MRETLRKTARLIGPGHWRRWLLLVLLALIVSAFEMIGAALVYVLVGVAADPSSPIDLPLVGDLRGYFADTDDEGLLIGLTLVLGLFFLARAALRLATKYAQARVAYNAGARLSSQLVRGYLLLPYDFHLRKSSAELVRNSYQAVAALVGQIFLPLINMAAESILIVGMLVLMMLIAPWATVVAVSVIGAAATILLLIVQPRLKALGIVAHQSNRETLSILQQALYGIRDVKLLAKERWFAAKYDVARSEVARTSYLRDSLAELPRTMIEFSLIAFILIFFGATLAIGQAAPETLKVIGLFAYVGLRLQPSIQRLTTGMNSLKFAAAPLDDLHSDLDEIYEAGHSTEVEPITFEKAITLEGVSFRYEEARPDVLSGIDLTIYRGEQVGICGPTGGGKTTLVDIITGLLVPTSGRVVIDDVDLKDHTREWQRILGVVPQTLFLLDDTLRSNIALGESLESIDETALEEAVDLAQIRELIESLPLGLETRIGERGIRLSGGQRQRIAVARALYRRPEVIFFDEGTSALDTTTEAALMSAIENLRETRTVILVAHRLSSVRNSDRLLFIESGRITGEGTYDELAAAHPSFRSMAGTQR